MPEELLELARYGRTHGTTHDMVLSDLLAKFAFFSAVRASVKGGNKTNHKKNIECLLRADENLASWPRGLPSEYAYIRVPEQPSKFVYSSFYDCYRSSKAGALWVAYRSIRVLLYQMILDNCFKQLRKAGKGSSRLEYDPQCAIFQSKSADLCAEVCAGVPDLLGHSRDGSIESIRPSKFGGGSVIWPLYVVASLGNAVSVPMFMWAKTQLVRIAESTGIRQAMVMADLLAAGVDISDWKTTVSS